MTDVNLWQQKLNIGFAILEIGPRKSIRLVVDERGRFMVSCDMNYYPTEQGELSAWQYEATLISADNGGDWAKYCAEDLMQQIQDQLQRKRLGLVPKVE
jgi:hypothetical protein